MDSFSPGFYILQAQIMIFSLLVFVFLKKHLFYSDKKNKSLFFNETKKNEESFSEFFNELADIKYEITHLEKDISLLAQKNIQWINSNKKLPEKTLLASILLQCSGKEEKATFNINGQTWTLMTADKWAVKLNVEEVSHWRPLV